jgi:hypothetical protein
VAGHNDGDPFDVTVRSEVDSNLQVVYQTPRGFSNGSPSYQLCVGCDTASFDDCPYTLVGRRGNHIAGVQYERNLNDTKQEHDDEHHREDGFDRRGTRLN